MRFLHLHVAEVADRFLVGRPIVARPAAHAAKSAHLMARIAAVSGESLGQQVVAVQHGNHAVHAAAAKLRRPAGPIGRQHDPEIDRLAVGVHRQDGTVHRGITSVGTAVQRGADNFTALTGSPIEAAGIDSPTLAAVTSCSVMTLAASAGASFTPGTGIGSAANKVPARARTLASKHKARFITRIGMGARRWLASGVVFMSARYKPDHRPSSVPTRGRCLDSTAPRVVRFRTGVVSLLCRDWKVWLCATKNVKSAGRCRLSNIHAPILSKQRPIKTTLRVWNRRGRRGRKFPPKVSPDEQ